MTVPGGKQSTMRSSASFEAAVCLTFDVDWAPDEVLDELVGTLQGARVRATLFATHASPSLQALSDTSLEIGLHPNFNDCDGDYDDRLRVIKDCYPNATGGRSHSLHVSSPILDLYARHGLSYESNIFLPMHPHLRPVLRGERMVSIPFWWADDVHFTHATDFGLSSLPMTMPGLKVFTFHPIHVFMNTASAEHYRRFKPYYSDPSALRPLRNPGRGIASLLEALLSYIAAEGARTWTMGEIAATFLQEVRV